jgi:hypothetical protein
MGGVGKKLVTKLGILSNVRDALIVKQKPSKLNDYFDDEIRSWLIRNSNN